MNRAHCVVFFAARKYCGSIHDDVESSARQDSEDRAYALLPEVFCNQNPKVVGLLRKKGVFIVSNRDPPVFSEAERLMMLEVILVDKADGLKLIHNLDQDSVSHFRRIFQDNETPFHVGKSRNSDVPFAVDSNNIEVFERLTRHKFVLKTEEEDELECSILHYVANKKLDVIARCLLEGGVDVRSVFFDGTTLLHLAAAKGSSAIVEQLLATNVDIDARDARRCTPLHYAADNGFYEVVKLLLARRATVNVCNTSYNRPLHLAAGKGHYEIVQELILKDASVNVYNNYYSTPLHLAASKGFNNVVQLLLAHNALVNIHAGRRHSTPLHLAAEFGWPGTVKTLLSWGASTNVYDITNSTPLHLALRRGLSNKVERLVDRDQKDPDDGEDDDGITPVQREICESFTNIVQLLIDAGAYLDDKDDDGNTPLHVVFIEGFYDIVCELEVHLTTKDGAGNTPFELALHQGFFKVIQLLIDRGAPLDAKNNEGNTPLHVVLVGLLLDLLMIYGFYNIGPALQRHLTHKPGAGNTPFKLELRPGLFKIIQLLIDRGAPLGAKNNDGEMLLHLASALNLSTVVQLLIERGAPVSAINNKGLTPLHFARDIEVATVLVKNNANVKAKSLDGNTPLHFVCEFDRTALVKLLIEYGAGVNDKNSSNSTPLNNVAFPEVAEILLRNGADVNSMNTRGSTPILRAVERDDLDLAKVLVKCGASIQFHRQSVLARAVMYLSFRTCSFLLESCFVDPSLLRAHLPKCVASRSWGYFRKGFAYHIVKIMALNIEDHNFDGLNPQLFIDDGDDEAVVALDSFRSQCESEVVRAKSQELDGSDVSVYDILTTDDCRLAGLLRNASVATAVTSINWEELYPLYEIMLTCLFDRGMVRNSIQAESLELCKFAFRSSVKLEDNKKLQDEQQKNGKEIPEEIILKILGYLTNEDISSLKHACSRRTL